ncbi:MAG: hypothetical protein LC794_04535 [Acidobacteria bacterium]|nr:hypothetical protein [Acidobacteriota bacterium]
MYIDTRGLNTPSGFSDLEKQAIKAGIESWNNQPNNSGVTFTVVDSTNPPTVPAQAHVAVVQYVNQQNPSAVAATQTFSSGAYVSNQITFYQNIRNVFNIPQNQPPFVRSVARHEGGHTVGLGNADDCPPGTTIMRLGSGGGEQFITTCDNDAVRSQNSVYPSPTPTATPPSSCPDVCSNPQAYPPATCFGPVDLCQYDSGCETGLEANGRCCCSANTPIILDILGNGFNLTSFEDGVDFDIRALGVISRISWTSANSDDAFLALDRNGNGMIDDGSELFGNVTPQSHPPAGTARNGFFALAEYDKPENGGDANGKIDERDAVYSSLHLWRDLNHNGVSEPGELSRLSDWRVEAVSLAFKESRRRDEWGNGFRYRAHVYGGNLGRWAYDIVLQSNPK